MRGQRPAALTILTVALAAAGVAGCASATHQSAQSPPATAGARTSPPAHALTSTIVAYAFARPDRHAHHAAAEALQRSRGRTVAAVTAKTLPHRPSHSGFAKRKTPVARPTAAHRPPSRTPPPAKRSSIAARALKPSVSSSKHMFVQQTITLPQRSRSKRHGGPASNSARRVHRQRLAPAHPGQGSSAPAEHGKSSHQPNERARGKAVVLTSVDPCTYVRRAQVAAALRVASVRAREAPLGPTCVFTVPGRTRSATLSVQVGTLPSELRRMRRPASTRIGGHRAYCGTLGQPLLLVKLSRYYVLSVAAPCDTARAVARAALRRIRA